MKSGARIARRVLEAVGAAVALFLAYLAIVAVVPGMEGIDPNWKLVNCTDWSRIALYFERSPATYSVQFRQGFQNVTLYKNRSECLICAIAGLLKFHYPCNLPKSVVTVLLSKQPNSALGRF